MVATATSAPLATSPLFGYELSSGESPGPLGLAGRRKGQFSASAFDRVNSNCTVRCSRDLQIGKLGHRGQTPACRCSPREGHPRSTEGHLEGLQFSVLPVAPAEVAEKL